MCAAAGALRAGGIDSSPVPDREPQSIQFCPAHEPYLRMLRGCPEVCDLRRGHFTCVGKDQHLPARDDLEYPCEERPPRGDDERSLFAYLADKALLRCLALLELTARQFPFVSPVQSQKDAAFGLDDTLHRDRPTHPSTITSNPGGRAHAH